MKATKHNLTECNLYVQKTKHRIYKTAMSWPAPFLLVALTSDSPSSAIHNFNYSVNFQLHRRCSYIPKRKIIPS